MGETFVGALLIALIIYLILKIAAPDQPRYCKNCGYTGKPVTKVRGSLLIEIILWLMFILPGLIYSIWRHSTKEPVCPQCESPHMIPVNSPLAKPRV